MDEIDEPAQHLRVRIGEDAVAEVEDVTRPPGGFVEDGLRPGPGGLPASDRTGRIEVALNAAVVTDPPPGVGQRDAVIEPDDLSAGLGEDLEQAAVPVPK